MPRLHTGELNLNPAASPPQTHIAVLKILFPNTNPNKGRQHSLRIPSEGCAFIPYT